MPWKEDEENHEFSVFGKWDGEYVGNIWGWKNSFIGLGIIVFMIAFVGIGHYTGKIDIREQMTEPDKSYYQQKVIDDRAEAEAQKILEADSIKNDE